MVKSNELKHFFNDYVIVDNKISAKRTLRWLSEKYPDKYESLMTVTKFLHPCAKINQRAWHVLNDDYSIKKCEVCGNPVRFDFLSSGYRRSCSIKCSQRHPKTIETIKQSNREKFGCDWPLQNKKILEKSKKTVIERYGVDNISKLASIKQKKEQTCLKNHGITTLLGTEKIKQHVMDKYGVDNVQKVKHIRDKRNKTVREKFYQSLFKTNRLRNIAEPLFSLNDYLNNGYFSEFEFKCTTCNTTFKDKLEDGHIPRCPICFKRKSDFEFGVGDFIEQIYSGEIIKNDRTILDGLELDLYFPDKNLAIECNGLYWHSEEMGKSKHYHLTKTNDCLKKGIRLIQIFEDEWMLNKQVVKGLITSMLIKETGHIYARNCTVVELNGATTANFLNTYHLQGQDKSRVKLGLVYKTELIAVMTFGVSRFSKFDGYELYRYAFKKRVVGGASKLLSYFIKSHHPTKIITYSDKRYFTGKLYESIGFTRLEDSPPGYWYFSKSKYYRQHRFGFKKSTLKQRLNIFDSNLTEYQNMVNNGYFRIWDCGNFKFIWTPTAKKIKHE